jgi:hypothetical protein
VPSKQDNKNSAHNRRYQRDLSQRRAAKKNSISHKDTLSKKSENDKYIKSLGGKT